jgi:hypothetical protein
MPKTRAEIEAELDELQPKDFNNRNTAANGMERLDALLPALVAVSTPGAATLTILKLMERLSNTPDLGDCEFGTPGPMVHELEKLVGYEPQLIESVTRFPTPLTIWMVNRIMNTLDKDDEHWVRLLELLRRSVVATNAALGAQEEAKQYVMYQETR